MRTAGRLAMPRRWQPAAAAARALTCALSVAESVTAPVAAETSRLADEKDKMAAELDQMEKDMQKAARDLAGTQPGASARVRDMPPSSCVVTTLT